MREPKDIKIGNYTLEEILERHQHWLNKDCENWENMQADLSYADLSYADLRCANMRCANMSGANISGADLSYANMIYANLRCANMRCANMSGANMRCANMSDTNISGANMRGANMIYANMIYADLSYANMSGANMRCANMSDTNISGANMRGANMRGADMRDTDRLRKGIKLSEPIIGWKKCRNNILVKLEIPRGAIVFSINNNKCRTDKAKVLEIIGGNRAYSNHKFFSYYVGDIIEVFNFNCEYNVECAEGIHFFKTREEAENY